jgi:hypothetical protein
MPVIVPKHGDESPVARTLLAMADDARDVKTNSDNGFSFLVPDYLYERYVNGGTGEGNGQETEVTEEVQRRRPGRPRKTQPPKEGD